MKHHAPMYEPDMCCLEDAGIPIDAERATYYLASEADARIAELERELDVRKAAIEAQFRLMERVKTLEKVLREVRTELETNAGLRAEYQDWADTFAIIDSVL